MIRRDQSKNRSKLAGTELLNVNEKAYMEENILRIDKFSFLSVGDAGSNKNCKVESIRERV